MVQHPRNSSSVTTKWLAVSVGLLWICSHDQNQNAFFVKGQDSCDSCKYNGNDATDCKDYGLLDNTELIAWYTGTQLCMDEYNIKINSPNAETICSTSSSFVSDMRFGFLSSSTARLGLGEKSQGGFFFEQDESNKVVLKESITVDGITVNCQASEGDCYNNAMKPYFANDPNGKSEMEDVCSTLFAKVQVDRQLEQSIIRGRLCMESQDATTAAIPSFCDPLWTQLEAVMVDYSDKACPFFQFGTQNTPIPGCDDEADGNTNVDKGNDDSSGSVCLSSRNVFTMATRILVAIRMLAM
jgi:hypothetical protein